MPNRKIKYKEPVSPPPDPLQRWGQKSSIPLWRGTKGEEGLNRECTELLIDLLKEGKSIRTKTSGGSMYPAVCKDDYIVIRPAEFKEIHAGDIIAFREKGGEGLLTGHRVVWKNSNSFITKGDANKFSDNMPVYPDELYGKVIKIEKRDKTVELERLSNRITSYIYARLSLIMRYLNAIID